MTACPPLPAELGFAPRSLSSRRGGTPGATRPDERSPPPLFAADPSTEVATLCDRLGRSVVLIVDDDEEWRNLGKVLLEQLGFEVIEASDAFEAICRFLAGGIDIVLTDVFMPDVDGVELIRVLRSIDPGLPIVAFTAAVEPQGCARSCGRHVPLLGKPLQLRQLEVAIRTSLDGRG